MQFIRDQQGTVECPIMLETVEEYDDTAISHMRTGSKNQLVSMVYYKLSTMAFYLKDYLFPHRYMHAKDPMTNKPFVSALPRRVHIALNAAAAKEKGYELDSIGEHFLRYIADPAAFKETTPEHYALLRHRLHIGDAGVLSTWGKVDDQTLREKAEEALQYQHRGSWLIRPCSTKSTSVFQCLAISYVIIPAMRTIAEPSIVQPADIRHLLVTHCIGYGYMVVNCRHNQPMPDLVNGVSNDVPLPEHKEVYGSFLDMLDSFPTRAEHFKMSAMVLNQGIGRE